MHRTPKSEHGHAAASEPTESVKVTRDRRKDARRREREHDQSPWTREHFMSDLALASRRVTQEIEQDTEQASALDRSREEARAGRVISQEDFDREMGEED